MYVVMSFLSKKLAISAHEQSDMLRQALAIVTNAISHIEVVKYLSGEHSQLQRYSTAITRSGGAYKKQANIRCMQMGITQFFTMSIFVQGFWYGSSLVIKGEKNSGQVLTTFWSAMMAVTAITAFLPQFIVLQKGKVAAARLKTLVAHISKDDSGIESLGDVKPQQAFGNIEFKQVS